MGATRINHVSIVADSLDESARFYEELFGMERIPTAKFPDPVLWLRLGDAAAPPVRERRTRRRRASTSSFDVEDFDAVYAKAKAMGILDSGAFGSPLRSHPVGWVQMYLRDPAGNLVEVDWPDVEHARARATLADVVELGVRRTATARSRRCITPVPRAI